MDLTALIDIQLDRGSATNQIPVWNDTSKRFVPTLAPTGLESIGFDFSATQKYDIKADSGDFLSIANTVSANNTILRLYTADGNPAVAGSGFQIHGMGTTSDRTNNERLTIESTSGDDSSYDIHTQKSGSGTLRPLALYTDGSSQILLNIDGSTTLGAGLTWLGGSILDMSDNAKAFRLTTDSTVALNITDAADFSYLNFRTALGSEALEFGDATLNQAFNFFGTGPATFGGNILVNGGFIGDTSLPGLIEIDGSLAEVTVHGDLIVDDDLAVDVDTLYVNSTTSRVGIGTVSPISPLQITKTGLGNIQGFDVTVDAAVSATTGRAFTIGINGEPSSRTVFYSNGFLGIGNGSTSRDVFIGRSTANTLRIGDTFDGSGAGNLIVGGDLSVDGEVVTSLVITDVVPSGSTESRLVLQNEAGSATGRLAFDWFNSSAGFTHARMYSEAGSAFNASKFYLEVADASRVLQTRLTIDKDGFVNLPQRLRIGDTTTPTYALEVAGVIKSESGRIVETTRLTSGTTLTTAHHHVFCDTGGAFTVSLPASPIDGQTYRIINSGSNTLTIDPNGKNIAGSSLDITLNAGDILIITYETTENWW